MSEENVELVAALQPEPDVDLVEIFREDAAWSNLVAVFEGIFHDDVETKFVGGGDTRSNYGVEGFRRTWLEWLEPWESYRAEIDRLLDAGDHVVVLTDDYGRKSGMTAQVRLFGAAVWTVRDGKIAAIRFFTDQREALRDVGLSAAILDGE